MKKLILKGYNHIWDNETKQLLSHWLKLMFSVKGIWFFIPTLISILATYWFMHHGYYDTEATIKPAMESISVEIIGAAAFVFLIRLLLYRTRIDLICTLLTSLFLFREIHYFKELDGIVVLVFILVICLAIYWKKSIIESIKNADGFLILFTTTVFTYIFALLVQRGFFAHVYLLPDEDNVSEGLEEVLENAGHMLFFLTAVIMFFSLKIRKKVK